MEPSEDEEDTLRIARDLTHDEWDTLVHCIRWNIIPYAHLSTPLEKKGLLVNEPRHAVVTPLGHRVWEWRELFR